ncbi:MAG: Methyltransferase type 11 [Candidatus Magasanikbacteria bacterium GW2011_GWC2_41_17]|uniref:Methyltransferase type 11 n=2 Tax=Candidatus Magasanikiibacteriota TaxID=1752731 RepID=A0A0G0WLJ8_9BACT|nr:MAG: Methyltransferase type 11 [Candidatus Magasanikbacteria bacterium GW2011_GWC2_41_17]KKS13629.1 MAG: Methyltransferase type 11 [Candidatus Magasanikbacteria bacterium GW2011_GWA2_41_55]
MQCQVCQSGKTKIIRARLRYNIKRKVYRCSVCGYVFLDPRKKKDREFYTGNNYRRLYGSTPNKISKCHEIFNTYLPFQDLIIKEIGHILKLDMKVLDVGCSTGHFLHALKGKVKERVGLELQKDAVSFIRKNLDFKVYSQSIETTKIKESHFDLVTCLQVLEHIENPLVFLNGLAKNLKPDGYLYLEVPNVNDVLLTCYKVAGYADFYFREPHISNFSINSLKILLRRAGFKGVFKTVQRYNIINHLHWILTNSPQGAFAAGNQDPVLVVGKEARTGVGKELNKFIKGVDEKYKKILAKHDVGENLVFLGKKLSK